MGYLNINESVELDNGQDEEAKLQEFEARLEPGDKALFACVRYPFDNRNLFVLLDGERTSRPFDLRGNFSREDLESGV